MESNFLCKIEGHGDLKLDFKKGKVKLIIDEGERLFEKLVTKRDYLDAPFITARICGICPTSHVLASVTAIENAFGVKVNDNIIALRSALQAGQIIQSHALHLFFLAAPDYLNVVNTLQLKEENPNIFNLALKMKGIGDKIVTVIGGRAVHPTTPTVGGFLSVPTKAEMKRLINELEVNLKSALETVELFSNFKYPSLHRETEYLATHKDGRLTYYGASHIVSNRNLKTPIENYPYAFKENIVPDSTAKQATINGHGFMVGALARISLFEEDLNEKAAYSYSQIWGKEFPTYNCFHNNAAQAIEIVHLMESTIQWLTQIIENKDQTFRVPYKVKAGYGVAAIEAPRGTLYHGVKINDMGMIELYDIVVPTVQNLINIKEDATYYLQNNIKRSEKKVREEIEMLIRAYDPCITCSVH